MRPVDKTLYTNRKLWNLIFPMILSYFLFTLVGIIDTMMIAQLGEAPVSGVSLVDMFNSLVISFFAALGAGGSIVAAQFIGAKNKPNALKCARQLILIAVAVGLATSILALAAPRRIIHFFYGELSPEVLQNALKYIYITALSYPFISLSAALNSLFRAMSRAYVCLYAAIIMNIANFCGNYLLIFKFHQGAAGAAYATLFSRIIAVVVLFYVIGNKNQPIWIDFKQGFRPQWNMIRKILCIGIPSGVENVIFQFGQLLVLGIIAKYGTEQIAGNALALSINNNCTIVGAACNLSMAAVIGQSVGTGSELTVRYYLRKMMNWTYRGHIAWTAVILLFLPLIFKCYQNVSEETRYIALSVILIHNLFGIVMWPAAFTFSNFFRAANDVKYTMYTSILSMVVMRIALGWLLAKIFDTGAIPVAFAMCGDMIVRIFFFWKRYRSNRWVKYAKLG